jgi:hypothetical protein
VLSPAQKHQFEQLSTCESNFTRAEETRWETIAPAYSILIGKVTVERVERTVLCYPCHPSPMPSRHSMELMSFHCCERSGGKPAQDFALDPQLPGQTSPLYRNACLLFLKNFFSVGKWAYCFVKSVGCTFRICFWSLVSFCKIVLEAAVEKP